MAELPTPDRFVTTADGRRIAVDDRGDPAGTPVVYLHGTPDSRLARHPDDAVAAERGIRLLALDRPGIGASDPDPAATPTSVADDVVAVLDHLGIDRAGVLAWSAGAVFALALAGVHPDRVGSVVLAAPLVPADAYADPSVLEGSDDSRRLFVESLGSMSPDELGAELAMWIVPPEIDDATAHAMLETSIASVREIHGAGEQLVLGVQASVAQGLVGVERDLVAQATLLGHLLDRLTATVAIHLGELDTVTPPAMGRWLGDRLGAPVTVHPGVGHAVAITAWPTLLAASAAH